MRLVLQLIFLDSPRSDAQPTPLSGENDVGLYHQRADKLLGSLETALDDVLSSLAEFDLESSVCAVAIFPCIPDLHSSPDVAVRSPDSSPWLVWHVRNQQANAKSTSVVELTRQV
jgi:hypothetical protein